MQIEKDKEFFKKEIVLLRDIEWVRSIAERIDRENEKISEKIKKLELENYVDFSEKKFLINKIISENQELLHLQNLVERFEKKEEPGISFQREPKSS